MNTKWLFLIRVFIFSCLALVLGSPIQANADGEHTITISDALAVSEADAGTIKASFTVTVSPAVLAGQTVDVSWSTADGTAVAPGDYTIGSGNLQFVETETTKTIEITIADDLLDEPDTETFFVNLSNPSLNAIITDGEGEGFIDDNDSPPTISIGNATVTEEDTTAADAIFTVSLSAPSGQTVTVEYQTADGSAAAPADYTSIPTTLLTFLPGDTTHNVTVSVAGDLLDEPDTETFFVNLSNPANATINDGEGLGTITDDDTAVISISDAEAVTEGNVGITNASFTVSLSNASTQTITVDYATADGSALASSDYTAVPTTQLTFDPGQMVKEVLVAVQGDALNEFNETFSVNLTNPSNATIADGEGIGTITDDDPPPTISISDADPVDEGNIGSTTNATFTISLSAQSGKPISINYYTTNGNATAPADYTNVSIILDFNPGETEKNVDVTVVGDALDEVDENFFVNLNPPLNATIAVGEGQGTGTITDDDPQPTITIGDATLTEGNDGTVNAEFTVTLSKVSGKQITVDYATANGTATGGEDYTSKSGTLTFNPPQTQQTIVVTVLGDEVDEINETFFVNLTNPENVSISDGQGTGTITDDDTATISIGDAAPVIEGNSGTTNAAFTVSLSTESSSTVTVNYDTANGSAAAPGDYTAIPATPLTFLPGEVSKIVNVAVAGDMVDEADEDFFVNLSSPTGAAIAVGQEQGTGTITDDDTAGVTVDPISLLTSEAPLTATFTVTLNSQPTANVTIGLSSSDTTEGTVSPTSLTFTPANWNLDQTVTVTGVNDNMADGPIQYTILTSDAASSDPFYDGLEVDDVQVTNADNDTPGIAVSPLANLTTSEGGRQATISILLSTMPLEEVQFQLESSDTTEGTVSPALFTITTETWNQVYTVTVKGVDDLEVDGDIAYTISVTTTSADPDYDDLAVEISALNRDAPTIEWVEPVETEESYFFNSAAPIHLRVKLNSPEGVVKVRFFWWDHVVEVHKTIAEVLGQPGQTVYEAELDPLELHDAYNQVFAVAFDAEGDASFQPRILLFREGVIFHVFLPLAAGNTGTGE